MTLTIEMALGFVGAAVTLAGFWWGIARWVLAEFGRRDLALQAEHARAKMAEEALARDIAAHKLYAAENFASKHEVANALERIEQSINRLADRLDTILMEKKQ